MQLSKLYKSKVSYKLAAPKKGKTSPALKIVFVKTGDLTASGSTALISGSGKKQKLRKDITGFFEGKEGQVYIDSASSTVLFGLGSEQPELSKFASLIRRLTKKLLSVDGIKEWQFVMTNDLFGLAGKHGAELFRFIAGACEYQFCKLDTLNSNFKQPAAPKEITFKVASKFEKAARSGIKVGQTETASVNHARQIASMPGNHYRPSDFEKTARKLGRDLGLKVNVIKGNELVKKKMGGIIAVSQGSVEGGRLISLEYNGNKSKNAKTFCIVGKGLTFDTGGISLKPPGEMHEMKYDMCGGAAALFAIEAIAKLKLNVNVVSIIASAENMPGAKAFKPGDVFTSHKGLTVEVQNTDAEGRLVLCDALAWSQKFKPDYMVDLATLTGAILISLGDSAAGLFGNDEGFNKMIKKASSASLDPVWEMPMWDSYAEGLKSDIADVRNIGGRLGGSISAGKFLEKFVPKNTKWAHLDIAGTAWVKSDRGMLGGPGATGVGVRLLVDLARAIGSGKK